MEEMDVEFWDPRVHSAMHLSAVQAAHLNNSGNHFGDDVRAWFPCPFCYADIEVGVLCSHLQEEHCFDLKNAVCPICAANLGRDAIGHFTLQHAQSVKRKRKSQKSEMKSSTTLVKGMRSFIGPNLVSGGRSSNEKETSADPLLLPFLCNLPFLDPEGDQQEDELSSNAAAGAAASSTSDAGRSGALDEAQEEDHKERWQRAAFLQQLILSTIF